MLSYTQKTAEIDPIDLQYEIRKAFTEISALENLNLNSLLVQENLDLLWKSIRNAQTLRISTEQLIEKAINLDYEIKYNIEIAKIEERAENIKYSKNDGIEEQAAAKKNIQIAYWQGVKDRSNIKSSALNYIEKFYSNLNMLKNECRIAYTLCDAVVQGYASVFGILITPPTPDPDTDWIDSMIVFCRQCDLILTNLDQNERIIEGILSLTVANILSDKAILNYEDFLKIIKNPNQDNITLNFELEREQFSKVEFSYIRLISLGMSYGTTLDIKSSGIDENKTKDEYSKFRATVKIGSGDNAIEAHFGAFGAFPSGVQYVDQNDILNINPIDNWSIILYTSGIYKDRRRHSILEVDNDPKNKAIKDIKIHYKVAVMFKETGNGDEYRII